VARIMVYEFYWLKRNCYQPRLHIYFTMTMAL